MRTYARILSAAAAPALLGAGAMVVGTGTAVAATPVTPAAPRVPVIVFLKSHGAPGTNQGPSGENFAAAEAPYLSAVRQAGAADIRTYRLAGAFAAAVPQAEASKLAASPGVAQVIPDSPIAGADPAPGKTAPGTPATAPGKTGPKTAAVPGACSKTPQLEPEGLSLTGTDSADPAQQTARTLGYTGAGVTVGFLADGIDTGNVNFMRAGRSVITDYEDFGGAGISAPTPGGTAFADANAIAGQGEATYNAQGFSALSPATPCDLRIEGTAPGADLVALKVFGSTGVTTTSAYLQGIDYAVAVDHVNVLDESFGADPFPDVTSLDAVREFNDAATAAGTTVVVAGGDAGPFSVASTPAADPGVISVGATTDSRFYAQTGYAAASLFARHGWLNDNISSLSSGGYTQPGGTVDMVAPGDLSFASCTADTSMYSGCVNFLGQPSGLEEAGGTSESASEVAGAAALVIQAYQKAHQGDTPSPAAVKQILTSTATDLGAPATEQGSGLLNSLKAVELAAGNRQPPGETLRLSSSQLNAVAPAGTKESWPVTVTNTGAAPQTVALAGRTSGASRVIKSGSVTLSDKSSRHFTSWTGAAGNYGTISFTVPPGQARLDASIAWPSATAGPGDPGDRPRVILVTPSGQFAGGSLPQGADGYGSAEVLHPAPGSWTAVILGDKGAAGGTTGKVQFGASVSEYAPFGTITPSSLTLAPGASATFTFTTVIPNDAGDSSGAIVLGSPSGTTSIPVTVRGMVPVPAGPASSGGKGGRGVFAGELTGGALAGGEGRGAGEGQVATYEFTVARGSRSVDADVTLAKNPAVPVTSYLIAPGGQTIGYGSNDLTTGFTDGRIPVESVRRQVSAFATDPIAGTWTLVVEFAVPVPGNAPADPFTGVLRLNSARVARGRLPSSAAVALARGRSYTYAVKITNTGAAPEDVFLDARLSSPASYTLEPQDDVSDVKLPMTGSAEPPEWIVPTMTQSVTAQAASAASVTFGFGPFSADPESASATGQTTTAFYPTGILPTPVTPGLWDALPSEAGPYAVGGASSAKATMSMTAETKSFDTAVTSPVGDFWTFAVEPLASSTSYNLFVINPGQTRVINATIRPHAPGGTVVKGTLYVDDFEDSLSFLAGSQIAALPYEYKVR
ncbi:MAG: S8 family peptidase [Trebonia sp.]